MRQSKDGASGPRLDARPDPPNPREALCELTVSIVSAAVEMPSRRDQRAEDKPRWSEVPASVRKAIEELLGAPVRRAMRVWGGYGPTPTFRLRLGDGQRFFVKGAHPETIEGVRVAYARERRVYEELRELLGRWAPAYHGSVEVDGWKMLALDDLGPKSAPPWSRRLAGRVLRDFADFHASTLDREVPEWVPRPDTWSSGGGRSWDWASRAEDLARVAALAGPDRSHAAAWIGQSAEVLAAATRVLQEPGLPWAFLHLDARSDNLRWAGDRLFLLDWPHVVVGPVEEDVAILVQSITVEGGPEPEDLLDFYRKRGELDPAALDGAVAAWAGFFATQASQPELQGLPRLRLFQRRQLQVTLRWAARRLGLPDPRWLESIEGG